MYGAWRWLNDLAIATGSQAHSTGHRSCYQLSGDHRYGRAQVLQPDKEADMNDDRGSEQEHLSAQAVPFDGGNMSTNEPSREQRVHNPPAGQQEDALLS